MKGSTLIVFKYRDCRTESLLSIGVCVCYVKSFQPSRVRDCAFHSMSTNNAPPLKYIFVDGLRTRPRGSVRAHISREVCRQKRIQKAQAYQNCSSSTRLGWQQRPTALHEEPQPEQPVARHSDDNSSHAKSADAQSNPTGVSQAPKGKAIPVRRYVMWDVGQTRRKHSAPRLPLPQRLPQKLVENTAPLEEAAGSGPGRDQREIADPSNQTRVARERGRHGRSGHGATLRPTDDMCSANSISGLGAGFLDPFQMFPVKMDPPTQRALYRCELRLPLPPYLVVPDLFRNQNKTNGPQTYSA